MNINRLIQIIIFSIIVIYSTLSFNSCANTSLAPTGGDKDTIPPVLVAANPHNNSLNIPLTKASIQLTFDEYVVLKNAYDNILLSPPIKKRIETKIKGKSVIISFPDTLLPNTTYSMDLGESIVDNNEGNIFPRYVHTFSTGDQIDSLYLTGSIYDAQTMLPLKKITIALYTDPSDSAVFNTTPVSLTRSDDWGFFTLRNIKDTVYSIYAFDDQNNNFKYDPTTERIAFLDSLYRPYRVMSGDVYELGAFNMKDTAAVTARESHISLSLFKEIPSRQFLKNKERKDLRSAFITFSAPYAIIDSLAFDKGIGDDIITQFNITRDSLEIWIAKQDIPIPDTLTLSVRYQKTDSLGNLSPFLEEVKMIAPKKNQQQSGAGQRRGSYDPNAEKPDSVLKYKLISDAETVEQNGFIFEFNYPLTESLFDSVRFGYTTPRMEQRKDDFSITRDSLNLRRYILKPKSKLEKGNEYKINVPKGVFRDVTGLYNDSLFTKVSLPTDDKLSSFHLIVDGVNTTYIVDMLSERRDKILRSFRINNDTTLVFPYLKAGKYLIRVTEDRNNNGIYDTGSVLEKRQPEKVILIRFRPGITNNSYFLEVPERAEIEQEINMEELFR